MNKGIDYDRFHLRFKFPCSFGRDKAGARSFTFIIGYIWWDEK